MSRFCTCRWMWRSWFENTFSILVIMRVFFMASASNSGTVKAITCASRSTTAVSSRG